jgi:hypothetical protein
MYVHWEDEMDEAKVMLMKVLYKLPSQNKPTVMDMVVASLSELMGHLAREGVTTKTAEYLYVHYSPRGTCDVVELVTVDNRNAGAKTDRATGTNVIPFPTQDKVKDAKSSKPRVRLKATNVEPSVPMVRSYLFSAQQA